jgi:hypothetical protein
MRKEGQENNKEPQSPAERGGDEKVRQGQEYYTHHKSMEMGLFSVSLSSWFAFSNGTITCLLHLRHFSSTP